MRAKGILTAGVLFLLTLATGCGADNVVNKSFFGHVAVDGYDLVAYFVDGKPVQGDKQFTVEHGGAIYRFASAEHRELFQKGPEKYLPAYGGFCAWAVAQGDTAGIDPEVWTINDGRLFLNYNRRIQAQWEKEMAANIAKGDANWPEIVAEKTN